MKVKNTLKKVGAVAGSALMVGMTMGAAQSLADFPQPFVDGDGTVASQIVVGSQGKVADVVGAVNVAAALGQSAVQTEQKTKTVSGGGGFGWSASDGATLDTRNDNLYFGANLSEVRSTLTADHLSGLSDTTFRDANGDTTDIEYFLYPGDVSIQFGNSPDDDQDPFLYVDAPSSPSANNEAPGNYLYRLQANLDDTITFNASAVTGEEFELFGNDYTVSPDTDGNTLILFGSSQSIGLQTGQSGTVTVNGNEHTIEVAAVNNGGVAYSVDGGSLRQRTEGETFNIDGVDVRIDNVVNLADDSGSAEFKVGSEELTLEDGQPIEDSDGNDIDGTLVDFVGQTSSSNPLSLSTINIHVGAENDNAQYVAAGDSWSHDLFGDYQFHFGGLNPDAGEGAGDNVGEVVIGTSGDDTATVEFMTSGGDDANVEWAHLDGSNNVQLEDSDGETIHVYEGAAAKQDQYIATDAGGFSHLWQVTDIDPESQSPSSGDEATVSFRDQATGSTVEADLDHSTGNIYTGDEVIDGQTYHFRVDTGGGTGTDDTVEVTWDGGAAPGDVGTYQSVYTALDTDSGGALAMVEDTGENLDSSETWMVQLPSTETTAETRVDVSSKVTTGGSFNTTFTEGQVTYRAVNNTAAGGSGSNHDLYELKVDPDGTGSTAASFQGLGFFQPEDDNDEEHVYWTGASYSGSSADEIRVDQPTYTGSWSTLQQQETNDDMEVAYDFFGTHTMYDSGDQHQVTLHTPDGQAVAGAGFTSAGGDLSAGGGTSTTVEYTDVVGMGSLPSMARLDTEVTESVRSNNHLILVGGPAVNTLVSTLADQGAVSFDDLAGQSSGAMISMVENAFVDGQHALVVAGVAGSDTRAAAKYLSDYSDHEQALSNADGSLVLTESDYPSTY